MPFKDACAGEYLSHLFIVLHRRDGEGRLGPRPFGALLDEEQGIFVRRNDECARLHGPRKVEFVHVLHDHRKIDPAFCHEALEPLDSHPQILFGNYVICSYTLDHLL